MKLRDIITNLDMSTDNEDWYGYIDDSMIFSLGLGCMGVYQIEGKTRLKCYWISKWLDSDTHCGVRAFFLDNEFIGISTQRYRRDDVVFEYINNTVKSKLRAYIMELTDYGEHDEEETMLDLDKEMGDGYTVTWAASLLDSKVIIDGYSVDVVDKYSSHEIIVCNINGAKESIDIRTAKVAYHLINPFNIIQFRVETAFTPEMIQYYEGIGWTPFDFGEIHSISERYGAVDDIFMASDAVHIVIKTKNSMITYATLEWDNQHGYYFKTPVGNMIKLSEVCGYLIEY